VDEVVDEALVAVVVEVAASVIVAVAAEAVALLPTAGASVTSPARRRPSKSSVSPRNCPAHCSTIPLYH
jgi:hypothetical protein